MRRCSGSEAAARTGPRTACWRSGPAAGGGRVACTRRTWPYRGYPCLRKARLEIKRGSIKRGGTGGRGFRAWCDAHALEPLVLLRAGHLLGVRMRRTAELQRPTAQPRAGSATTAGAPMRVGEVLVAESRLERHERWEQVTSLI